ncbi:MAG TPA: hypothetical protein PKA82_00660 [Pyrinomonadaceae bacterium]|nr:hypothetical protein [Pyrinomonadaceae bacterium]
MTLFFLDANLIGGGIGIFLAVAFFLVLAAVAFIAFKMLKKSVKMAVRMVIVVVIMAIAVTGTIGLWYASSRPGPKPPVPTNRR